jgi:hypothetical protein
MTMAHDLIIDQFSATVDRQPRLTTWYAQGQSDGLGDRLLMFDNTSAPSWEILRFAPALARDRRFELALRDSVHRLESFEHPMFPAVRPIKELGHEDGLAVVSTYAAGARLSEALKKPRSTAFALRLIRELVPALAALQQHAAGMAHGALDADRIVVTAKGQLMIREHMVAAALGSLGFSSTRLWTEFGIATSPGAMTPPLDSRNDIVQLGLVIVSLLLGRRIGPDEYPDRIDSLLDDIAERTDRQTPGIFRPLRSWLERALQIDDNLFDSAQEAHDALANLPDGPERPEEYFVPPGSNVADLARSTDSPQEAGSWRQVRSGPRLIASNRLEVAEEPVLSTEVAEVPVVKDEATEVAVAAPPVRSQVARVMRWMAVAAAVLAVGEGLFIGRLLYARAVASPAVLAAAVPGLKNPAGETRVENQPVPSLAQASVGPQVELARGLPEAEKSGRKGTEVPATAKPTPAARSDAAAGAAAAVPIGSQRTGGFRLTSPIELHVLDGDRVLGSSADGPIVAPAGLHTFEFVNSAIGYRERKLVDVKAGQITALSVVVPNGTLNINAVPWASVWIDGSAFGETPLGNLSIAPGEHEIVFRHPQLGERRQSTIVRAAATTRVSVNLQP